MIEIATIGFYFNQMKLTHDNLLTKVNNDIDRKYWSNFVSFYGCCCSCCIKKADIFGNIIYYYCELIFIADKQCVHFIEKCKRNQSASGILCEIDSIKRVNRLNIFFCSMCVQFKNWHDSRCFGKLVSWIKIIRCVYWDLSFRRKKNTHCLIYSQ